MFVYTCTKGRLLSCERGPLVVRTRPKEWKRWTSFRGVCCSRYYCMDLSRKVALDAYSKKPLLDGVPQVLNSGYVRELFVKSVAWDGNCHVYMLSVTGCCACSIKSGAANEMWRLRWSTTAVYRRKRRFWYIQLVHVSWEGKLLVGVSDHESVQEAYWTWFENESFL
jgi:hypothetical protein